MLNYRTELNTPVPPGEQQFTAEPPKPRRIRLGDFLHSGECIDYIKDLATSPSLSKTYPGIAECFQQELACEVPKSYYELHDAFYQPLLDMITFVDSSISTLGEADSLGNNATLAKLQVSANELRDSIITNPKYDLMQKKLENLNALHDYYRMMVVLTPSLQSCGALSTIQPLFCQEKSIILAMQSAYVRNHNYPDFRELLTAGAWNKVLSFIYLPISPNGLEGAAQRVILLVKYLIAFRTLQNVVSTQAAPTSEAENEVETFISSLCITPDMQELAEKSIDDLLIEYVVAFVKKLHYLSSHGVVYPTHVNYRMIKMSYLVGSMLPSNVQPGWAEKKQILVEACKALNLTHYHCGVMGNIAVLLSILPAQQAIYEKTKKHMEAMEGLKGEVKAKFISFGIGQLVMTPTHPLAVKAIRAQVEHTDLSYAARKKLPAELATWLPPTLHTIRLVHVTEIRIPVLFRRSEYNSLQLCIPINRNTQNSILKLYGLPMIPRMVHVAGPGKVLLGLEKESAQQMLKILLSGLTDIDRPAFTLSDKFQLRPAINQVESIYVLSGATKKEALTEQHVKPENLFLVMEMGLQTSTSYSGSIFRDYHKYLLSIGEGEKDGN